MSIPQTDIFDQVNRRALLGYLERLKQWMPGGKVVGGKEYVVVNPTRADRKPGSFSINFTTGQWLDGATGDAGGDPISLYAYVKCGGTGRSNRVEACKLLRAELGLSDDAPAPRRKPELKVVPKEEPADWQPIVPPPDDVPGPNVSRYDHVFVYRDRAGRLLRYVVRNDADKWIRPLTYGLYKGKPGWELRGPNDPKSLYGLERLDGRPVLLQEGEKKTDAVAPLLPGYACLSLTGGTGQAGHNDLTTLAGMAVLYCPDNDEPGRKAAVAIIEKLVALGCTVLLVDVFSHGFKDKWDLGNAVEDEHWPAEKLEAFVRENARPFDPCPGDIEQEDDDPGEEWLERKDQADTWWIRPLGHIHGVMYYLARRSWTVFALGHDQHTKMKLIGMAPMEYWYQTRFGAGGKIKWDEAADDLIRQCENQGTYKIDTVRGRGAWLDNGRTVLHLGDMLLVDGVPQGLDLEGSRHVYERREAISQAFGTPLKSSEAIQLYHLIEGLKWEEDINKKLMAGWIVCALVCGALDWRPHAWITGGSGAGKTTLIQDIVEPVLGGLVCQRSSTSTEAGIRQGLDGDALAVLFDEAEAESVHDRHRMQGVLDLGRQSSKEGSAPIVKGTQTQTGAKSYTVRSCFLFSSINISMNKLADESRITVLGLKTTAKGDKVAMAHYAALRLRITDTLTVDFRAGLLARIVSLLPKIKANALTFARAAAEELGSNRAGDQVGAMLAGYYALTSSRELTLDEARKIVSDLVLDNANSADAERDEQRLVNFLFQQTVTVKMGGSPYERTIGRLVRAAAGNPDDLSETLANEVLLSKGIKFDKAAGGVWIANQHASLADWLKDTPWATNWNRALKRLDGAVPSTAPVWFGPDYPGRPPRAVFVPVRLQSTEL
jgi:putative DNA primase/helicase